jgi:Copper chaperone
MSRTLEFSLSGLSCNHCVAQVKKILEQRSDVTSAQVSLDHATVDTTASPEILIDVIKDEGYQAQLDH